MVTIGFRDRIVGGHGQSNVQPKEILVPPPGARTLLVQAIGTAAVRYTLDGTVPTSSIGFRLAIGEAVLINVVGRMIITFVREDQNAKIAFQWGS